MKRMTLMSQVVQAVKEEGRLSTDDLAALFPTYTKKQISAAVQNASNAGRLKLVGLLPRNGKAQGGGIWEAGDVEATPQYRQFRPVSSVFDLAYQ